MRSTKLLAFTVFAFAGCLNGPAFMKQNGSAALSTNSSSPIDNGETSPAAILANQDGVLTAAIDPNSNTTQLVAASDDSAIAGSAVMFPPGSVAISTSVTIEQGVTLTSADVAQDLGVGDASVLTAASPAVVISTSAAVDAVSPFTVALVLGSSLTLADEGRELVVIYKIKKASDGGIYVGVIPKEEVTVANGKATFSTIYFGSYQAVYTAVPLAKDIKPTSAPIVTAREEKLQAPQEQPKPDVIVPKATTNVKKLAVKSVGPTFVELKWDPADVAAGYIVRWVEGSTVPAGCRAGSRMQVDGRETPSVMISGLTPGRPYAFRVCSYAPGAEDSAGAVISQNTPVVPGSPAAISNLNAVAESSARIVLNWSPAPGAVYRVNEVEGTTAPSDCGTAPWQPMARYRSHRHAAQTDVSFRICGSMPDGSIVSATRTVRTANSLSSSLCTSGNLDDPANVCTISDASVVAAGAVVAGLGSVTISASLMPQTLSRLSIDMGGTVNVQSGGSINADGKGYQSNSAAGPGSGPNLLSAGKIAGSNGGGGAYGGNGGYDVSFPGLEAIGYGDYAFPGEAEPLNFAFGASGAKATPASDVSHGGGAIRIEAPTINVTGGTISANGMPGNGTGNGGGAGGSILIITNYLSIDTVGAVSANGGAAGGSAGGGGGGRIAVHYSGSASVDHTYFKAEGGQATDDPNNKSGAAGTVFISESSGATLAIRGQSYYEGNAAARTPFDPNHFSLKELYLDNARVYLSSAHTGLSGRITNVTINNGAIDHSGMGAPGGAMGQPGEGDGGGAGAGANKSGAGGGHAGTGQTSYEDEAPGGGTYGSEVHPTTVGSGGGGGGDDASQTGGAGGGAIRLIVDGTLALDATSFIVANGLDGKGTGNCGGGGAGGSIWITAHTIAGQDSPHFIARGGTSLCSTPGGGGGGGYIDLEASNITGGVKCIVQGGQGHSSIYGSGGAANVNGTTCPNGS